MVTNIGVAQYRRFLGFSQKAPLGLVVVKQMSGEELQSNRPLKFGVLGLVDDTRPALSELFGDLVVADDLADHRPQSWGNCTPERPLPWQNPSQCSKKGFLGP